MTIMTIMTIMDIMTVMVSNENVQVIHLQKDQDDFVLLDDCERTLNFIDNYGHKGKLGWFKNDRDDDYDDDSSMMIMRITTTIMF